MNLTPMQKLARLKQIEDTLEAAQEQYSPARALELDALRRERARILSTVAMPPLHLMGNPDPSAWAEEFAKLYTGVGPTDLWGWFCNAMMAASADPYKVAQAIEPYQAAHKEMFDTLQLIKEGVRVGYIRSPMLQDGEESLTLEQLVDNALAKAGEQ